MKKVISIFLFLLFFAGCVRPGRYVDYGNTQENVNRMLHATAALVLPKKTEDVIPYDTDTQGQKHKAYCSAAAISKNHLLTAAHCLELYTNSMLKLKLVMKYGDLGEPLVKASFYEYEESAGLTKRYVFYKIKKVDEDKDLALLEKKTKSKKYPKAVFDVSNRKKLFYNEKVYAVGNPYPILWNMTNGRITSIIHNQKDLPALFVTNSQVYKGSSGCPAIDKTGKLIGIASVAFRMQGYLAGFVHPAEIRSFLNKTEVY